MKKLETVEQSRAFNEVVEATLSHNRADTHFDRLGLHANQEPEAKVTISAIHKRAEWTPPTPANTEVIRPMKVPATRPSVRKEVMVGLLVEMRDLRINMQQKWAEQEDRSPKRIARQAPVAAAAGMMTGMNVSTCFWWGNEGHKKTRCPDYQNSLTNRMIHPQGADPRTILGPQGCGGPIVPSLKDLSLWQQFWVNRERRKPESAMQEQRRIEEVTEVSTGQETMPAGKLRKLGLKEKMPHPQTPFVGAQPVEPPQLNLCPGEVRAYMTQESEDVIIQGWVEAKRTAEEMKDSITLTPRDPMRNRHGKEVSYPQAGARSETPV